jgi:hypothetical protein
MDHPRRTGTLLAIGLLAASLVLLLVIGLFQPRLIDPGPGLA